jgi:hypothetical protein
LHRALSSWGMTVDNVTGSIKLSATWAAIEGSRSRRSVALGSTPGGGAAIVWWLYGWLSDIRRSKSCES